MFSHIFVSVTDFDRALACHDLAATTDAT